MTAESDRARLPPRYRRDMGFGRCFYGCGRWADAGHVVQTAETECPWYYVPVCLGCDVSQIRERVDQPNP